MDEHDLIEKLDLRAHLEFVPSEGKIWLDQSRMLLVHARAFGKLRGELIENVGLARARSMLWHYGFESGKLDAKVAAKHFGEAADDDVFRIGPALHALEGITHSHLVEAVIDWEKGNLDGFVHWTNCWEAQAHIDQGIPADPEHPGACWTATGYASGYVTEFFKGLVIFQETQCASGGHDHCIAIGKPAGEWEDQTFIEMLWTSRDDRGALQTEEELRKLRRERQSPSVKAIPSKPKNIVGASPAFEEAFHLIGKAAGSRISVLLLGETGVGKEVFARWLHENSKEAEGPFVAVNCSAIPAELVEAELFGVRRGAFTGAVETRAGRFERANNGTLFLDEVGDLPLAAQAKLLRVLQTGEVERLGDDKPTLVNVRLISATNIDLAEAMRAGRFRSDLYYRLATYPITLPALRDRPGDVALLADAMIARFSPLYEKHVTGIAERAMRALEAYSWPGNVRELENVIERAVLLVPPGEEICVEHLPTILQEIVMNQNAASACLSSPRKGRDRLDLCCELIDMGVDLEQQEQMMVKLALDKSDGNITAAAKLLNITRRQLTYRMQKLDLPLSDTDGGRP